jgi:PST family polysaccharide transporter
MLSTYGFNFSATKRISQCRDDKQKVSNLFNSVIASKSIIALVLVVLLLLLSHWVFKDNFGTLMFVYSLGMVIGDIFTPIWLFQGMEKMKFMTIVNASSKILFTILIFVFIQESSDYYLLILLNSCGYLLSGLLSIVLVKREFKLRFHRVGWDDIVQQFKDGSEVFGSTLGMNLYRNANVIILKQFFSDEIVGLYSAAEKVVKGFQSVISPAAQALFPHLSLRFKGKSISENIALLKKISLPFSMVVVFITIMVFIFAPLIIKILCGDDFAASVPLVRIMTLVILFGEINYLIGIVGLINMNGQSYFFRSVIVAGVFSVTFVLLLLPHYGVNIAAWAMSLAEILLFLLCLLSLYRITKHNGGR